MQRKFNTYEFNWLIKHGVDPTKLDLKKVGSTPVEYLVEKAEFYGREFVVNKNVLIPRVETEGMIKIAIDHLTPSELRSDFPLLQERVAQHKRRRVRWADIGTGSGCIGITFALELEKLGINYEGYLSDKSEKALAIARQNKETLAPNSNIEIFKSDLLEGYSKLEARNSRLDIIFANLPYIPSNRIKKLDSSVKDFEPKKALDGGKDGLKYIKKLLEQAPKYLAGNGIVILEVDDSHDELQATSHELRNWKLQVLNDENKKVRFWVCRQSVHA